MADYTYGFNCIVAKVKSSQELDLKFVLNRKQYTVAYRDNKDFNGERKLSKLLTASDALKASIWNVPTGPPGSKTRSWYVTDIWNPNITGMEKSRLPEPTISIVCKISHLLGNDFFLCELGRHFTKDIVVLPRSLVHSVVKYSSPEVGDYLLVFCLIVWEVLDDSKISRLVPLWAYWDTSNCAEASIAHLNIVERGPENSTLLIPDQIPCVWGVVQSVSKKKLTVYVPCIASSVSIPKIAIFQCDSEVLAEDWLQLWLTPQVNGKVNTRISHVTNWVCSYCCWFGRAKKRYEAYLQHRLNEHYVKPSSPSVVVSEESKKVPPAAVTPATDKSAPKVLQQAPTKLEPDPEPIEIGIGKVLEVREKSGFLKCRKVGCKMSHVFHMGLMTIYGVKMAEIKSARMEDLVGKGSELRYKMNPKNHHLRAVWVGPEHVTFKHLNFLPQLHDWFGKRNLNGTVIQEMVNYIIDNYEMVSNASTEPNTKALASGAPQIMESMNTVLDKISKEGGDLVENKSMVDCVVPQRGSGDGRDHEGFEEAKQLKEEDDKICWSADSEESEDELAPVLSPSGGLLSDNDGIKGSEEEGKGNDDLKAMGEVPSSPEKRNSEPAVAGVGTKQEILNRKQDSEKVKRKKTSLLMTVLVELTKFLVEKGKSETVSDACELSADFVARLEKALEGITDDDPLLVRPLTQSVGLQTEVSGPISPVQDPLFGSQIQQSRGNSS